MILKCSSSALGVNAVSSARTFARVVYAPRLGKRVVARLYSVWTNMKKRCFSPTNVNYPWYGARGITVCAEWMDYAVFRAWAVSTGFRKDITLDRIDCNGNYEPANCRWVGRDVQQLNMRRRGPVPNPNLPIKLLRRNPNWRSCARGRKAEVPNELVS